MFDFASSVSAYCKNIAVLSLKSDSEGYNCPPVTANPTVCGSAHAGFGVTFTIYGAHLIEREIHLGKDLADAAVAACVSSLCLVRFYILAMFPKESNPNLRASSLKLRGKNISTPCLPQMRAWVLRAKFRSRHGPSSC